MKNLKSIYKFIVSKEKVFFVFSAGIYLTFLVLHILFYTQADKLVKGIEMVVIPVIVYGGFKLMFESVRKKVYEDSVTYMIAFFCLGAIYGFIMFVYKYVTMFPNGLTGGINLTMFLFLELISEMKKTINDPGEGKL